MAKGEGPGLAAVCVHGLEGVPVSAPLGPKTGYPRTPSKVDEKDTIEQPVPD